MELKNIRGVEVIDFDEEGESDGGAGGPGGYPDSNLNILDQINQIDQENIQADRLAVQDKEFFKSVFELLTEAGIPKGPDYVPKPRQS